jgi:hypothetical protein
MALISMALISMALAGRAFAVPRPFAPAATLIR